MVPGMVLLLGVKQHIAQGVSLCIMAPTALLGSLLQYRRGNLDMRLALKVAAGAVLFAALGATLAEFTPPPILSKIFGGLLIVVGLRMILRR